MPRERRLWLVRHGETEGQSSIRYHGSNDVPLSELGRQQIRGLSPLLIGVRFVRVVHSPLSRAAESAQILLDGRDHDAEPTVDARLREISFGACEGLTREEIDARWPTFFDDYHQGRVDAFPDGEPRTEFAARIAGAVRELVAEPWQGDALLVAHRGTVRHAIAALLGADAEPAGGYGVELGSLSVLHQNGADAQWRLELLGMRL